MSQQSFYNLANRAIEQEMIPALEHFGVGLLPWSPLARSVLAGRHPGPDAVRRTSDGAQLEATVSASEIVLDAETLAELDRIWPGPGTALQSCAW